MDINSLIIGGIFGACLITICFFAYFYPRVHKRLEVNEQTLAINKNLLQENEDLCKNREVLEDVIHELERHKETALDSLAILRSRYEELDENLSFKLNVATEEMRAQYEVASEDAKTAYLELLKDYAADMQTTITTQKIAADELAESILSLKKYFDAALLVKKREVEKREQENFYKINITHDDQEEIQKLRQIIPYLRDPEPLNKVIWKVYYENATTDLIGRVVGEGVHTGIYKITNIENGMSYVGQAVNIAERWKQHIKRGLGADTPTRNKLYPAMNQFGLEVFTFEVIEECEKDALDEREDYWQEFFQAKSYGYSIK